MVSKAKKFKSIRVSVNNLVICPCDNKHAIDNQLEAKQGELRVSGQLSQVSFYKSASYVHRIKVWALGSQREPEDFLKNKTKQYRTIDHGRYPVLISGFHIHTSICTCAPHTHSRTYTNVQTHLHTQKCLKINCISYKFNLS